jgi:uncharacterized cupredoxin-like copper-binding protein
MRWIQLGAAIAAASLSLPATALAASSHRVAEAQVTVTLTDTKLGISPSGLQAGSTTFHVVNNGKRLHAFQITGPGLKKGLATAQLAPGKTASLTLKLQSGAYMVTLSNPAGMGMSATHWVQVIPRTVVRSSGSGVVQSPPDSPSPVCGGVMP